MNKYLNLYKEFLAIKRTKSENITAYMTNSVLLSNGNSNKKEMDRCLNGVRTRIEQEEEKQVKSLLISTLNTMMSDRILGDIDRYETIFADVFEKYRYLFNGPKKELGYLKIIDKVLEDVKTIKMKTEKDLAAPVIFRDIDGKETLLWMIGIEDHINSVTLHVKDRYWNENTLYIETDDTAFKHVCKNALAHIDKIEIEFVEEKPEIKLFVKNNEMGVLSKTFNPRKITIGRE